MNSTLLFAAAAQGNMVQETARTFGWNGPMFLAQLVSFCIVAFLLHRFAYKPILAVLEERRQRIAQSLSDVQRIKVELAQAEVARQEILSNANNQALRLIEEARAAAARVQEQETQKAISAAEQIMAKAREAAQADHARMLAELRREVGRLVVETTARVSGKVLGAEDQRRLTEETTRQLAA